MSLRKSVQKAIANAGLSGLIDGSGFDVLLNFAQEIGEDRSKLDSFLASLQTTGI